MNKHTRILLPGLFVLMLFQVLCAVTVLAIDVDEYVKQQMEARHIPGVSIAVVQDGKVVLARGYGMANVELAAPATEETVYELASVTKQFTATAIMMLIEAGKLSLDSRVTEVLDNLPAAWNQVTVRHLLNHTSGIKSYTGIPDFFKTARRDYTKTDLIKLVTDLPMDFAPGEKYAYNNTGFFLLGMIIEKISGKDYDTFLRERIFQPLGMTASRHNNMRDIIRGRAQGYAWENGALRNCEYLSPTQPFSAGALVSSVLDLAKWDAALYTDKLLKQASLAQMWTPTKLNDGKTENYGFGWATDVYRTRKRIAHGGGIQGFSTYIARFIDDKVTVIVLTNREGGGADALAMGVAEFFIPALKENAPKAIADSNPQQTNFLRQVTNSLAGGNAEPNWFTPDAQKFFFPDRVKEGKQMLGALGEMKSFELLEDTRRDQQQVRSYKAVFGNTSLRISFMLSAEGKIAGIGIRPE